MNSRASPESTRLRRTHHASCPSLSPWAQSSLTDSLTQAQQGLDQPRSRYLKWTHSGYRGSFNLLWTHPFNFNPGLSDDSAPWGLQGGGSGMSLPRAVTASASQTPPGAAPPSAPESPTPLLAPLPPLRLSTCQGTGHLLLAQPGPLLSLEGLSPQGAWGPISTHLTNYTLWERQSTVWGPAHSSPWQRSLFLALSTGVLWDVFLKPQLLLSKRL